MKVSVSMWLAGGLGEGVRLTWLTVKPSVSSRPRKARRPKTEQINIARMGV